VRCNNVLFLQGIAGQGGIRRQLKRLQVSSFFQARFTTRPSPAGRARPYVFAIECENTTSTSVPERVPVLILNCARLASTSALVKDRLTAASGD